MAKITALELANALTGDEHLPIVQGTRTKRVTMAAFRDLITPFLQNWYKGDAGATGPANSTFPGLELMKAAPYSNRSFLLATSTLAGFYAAIDGDFSGDIDDAAVVRSYERDPRVGALLRVDAMKHQFPSARGGTDQGGVVSWRDASRGRRFFGGTDPLPQNDEKGFWNDWIDEFGRGPKPEDQGVYAKGGARNSYSPADYGDADGGHDLSDFGVAGFVRGAGSSVGAAVPCRFSASFAGTTMTVTDVDWGVLSADKVLRGAGINPGTKIIRQLTSTGEIDELGNPTLFQEGTYEISSAHNLGSQIVKLGKWLDIPASFLGYCAGAIGKNCQAVGEKAIAFGEDCLAWGRASAAIGYMAKAWRGIGTVALGNRVEARGTGVFAIGSQLRALYGAAIGKGVNNGSPLVNMLRGTLAIGMNTLRGTVRFWPGAQGDSYTGWVGSYSGWHGVGDVGVATDIDLGSITWPIVNGGGGGYVDLLLRGLRQGAVRDFMRIDGVGLFPEFFGDRVRLGTPRTIPTSGSTGVTGEMCWDQNYLYLCVAANTWRRTVWGSSAW